MSDRMFTLKDWKRIKRDIFDEYFTQHDMNYDLKEFIKAQTASEEEIPEEVLPEIPQVE